ncbi:MAG: aminodeoxychorismate lyase [Nitrospinaceae bacterium]|nr:MAG: aminodeoxychorismate lyase [Nitrospinaceae bacterium]
MSGFKKFAFGSIGAVLVIFWIVGGFFYYLATHSVSEEFHPEIVNIAPGMTLKKISTSLEDKHLIRSSISFQLLAHLQKKQGQIQVGEYELSPSMTPGEILLKVTSGKTVLHAATIPEGYRITEIAALLAERGLANREEFIRQTQDNELIQSSGIPGNSLEGYLFPETYHFSRNTPEQKIVQKMLKTFKEQVATADVKNRAKALNLTFHQIITLASLIEKETGVDEERKIISSVFHNRLKKDMRLQTDPTVIYAISNFDGNIRKKDLSIDSPYNTYKYKGLPPGPIASPGLKSIVAALNPDDTNYLYFVSRKNGSHQFSSTLMEHNRAVQKYQLRRIANRGRP